MKTLNNTARSLIGKNPAAWAAAHRNIEHGQDMGASKTWCGVKIVPRGQVGQWPITTYRHSRVECKNCLAAFSRMVAKEDARQAKLSRR